MIGFPVYALAQVTVMPLFGIAWYLRLAKGDGHLGRYRFPHRRAHHAQGTIGSVSI
jgi:hypothetical protein